MTAKQGIINIRGKQYETVSHRLHRFRQRHSIADGWAVLCELVSADDKRVLMRATIVAPGGQVVAAGYAEEMRGKGINATSAIENCETSAIGRALAAAGYLGEAAYCSADEMQGVLAQAKAHPSWEKDRAGFCARVGELGYSYDDLKAWCIARGKEKPSAMDAQTRKVLVQWLADKRPSLAV